MLALPAGHGWQDPAPAAALKEPGAQGVSNPLVHSFPREHWVPPQVSSWQPPSQRYSELVQAWGVGERPSQKKPRGQGVQ